MPDIDVEVQSNDVVIDVETTSSNPEINVDAQSQAVSEIDTVALYGPQGPRGPKGDNGDKGDTGATGNGIVGTEKTSTVGNVDTYTITYTNGDTDTFTVTNANSTFVFTQAIASDTWDITHNMNKYPYPICVDSTGAVFEPAWEYPRLQDNTLDKNRIILTMNGATTGQAYLN